MTIFRLVNLRHLWERPRRTLLTLAGLAASVCLLIAISVINSTLNNSIEGEIRGLAGDAALEVASASTGGLGNATLLSVRRAPGVRAAVPFLQEISRVRRGGTDTRVVIFGLPAGIASLFPAGLGDTARQLADQSHQAGGLILTRQIALSLGVRPGDTLAVETPRGYRRLRVSALLAQGPFASVNGGQFALMALSAAQTTFGRTGRVDGIYVAARAGSRVEALRTLLQRQLGGGTIVETPGAGAQAYKQTFDSIASISEESRTVGLVVAFFLVLNTMSMSLAERREEIAILVVGGASREQIVGAFLGEAAFLGALGGLLGVAGGAALAHALLQRAVDSYNILPITAAGPLAVRPIDVLLGLAGGLTVTLLGAFLPALRILRAAPIDALRPDAAYEWGTRRAPRLPRIVLLFGIGTISLSALMARLLPLGSSSLLAGLALVLALVGATLTLPWLVPALARGVRGLLTPLFGPIGRLAADAVIRTPGRTTIAAGGLAMAASFLIAVGTSVNSYRAETERAARAWYGAPLYINAQGSAAYISDQPLPGSLAQQLDSVPGVAAAYPMRFGVVDNHGHQLIVYALPVAQAALAGWRITGSLGISEAQLVGALGRNEFVISRLTARRHGLSPGNTFRIPTSRGYVRLRIGGVFEDIASFDSVFLEHALYAQLTGDTSADRFAVVIKPGAGVAAVKQRLQHFVQASGIPATVLTQAQMAGYLVNSIQSLFSIAEGVEVAALFVAALIVLSTMLTATFERRREFAIQRVLGISRRQLGGSVVLEAIAISSVGAITAVGVGLGLGFLMTFSIENDLAWRISFTPSLALLLGTTAAVILLGALAALYPSLVATRQTIVRLIRDE